MIQIAIIEDNRFVRDGLALKLGEQADFTITYTGADGSLEDLRAAAPQVLLLDVGLEGEDSLLLAERLRSELPGVRVIVMDLLPVHEDIVEFVSVGATGFILSSGSRLLPMNADGDGR